LWLIAGLGNPGPRYAGTRHNAGFMVVGELSRRWGIPLRTGGGPEQLGRGRRGEEEVILLEPLSFMNRSGPVVARRAVSERVPLDRLLVVVDDLQLPLGTLRLRPDGSSGGHNGLTSIIESLASPLGASLLPTTGGDVPAFEAPPDAQNRRGRGEGFPRLRVGIGRPPAGPGAKEEVVDYVLAPFLADERDLLAEVLAAAAGLVERAVDGGHATSVTVNLA
jgi:peptidyl-tRNA hydrolase, PTH1 family